MSDTLPAVAKTEASRGLLEVVQFDSGGHIERLNGRTVVSSSLGVRDVAEQVNKAMVVVPVDFA